MRVLNSIHGFLHDVLYMVGMFVTDGLGEDTTVDNSEVSVTDSTSPTSAIREAGIKQRPPCRIGKVAWVQENFSVRKCASGITCMYAKPRG